MANFTMGKVYESTLSCVDRAIIGPLANCHLNGVSLAGR